MLFPARIAHLFKLTPALKMLFQLSFEVG